MSVFNFSEIQIRSLVNFHHGSALPSKLTLPEPLVHQLLSRVSSSPQTPVWRARASGPTLGAAVRLRLQSWVAALPVASRGTAVSPTNPNSMSSHPATTWIFQKTRSFPSLAHAGFGFVSIEAVNNRPIFHPAINKCQ